MLFNSNGCRLIGLRRCWYDGLAQVFGALFQGPHPVSDICWYFLNLRTITRQPLGKFLRAIDKKGEKHSQQHSGEEHANGDRKALGETKTSKEIRQRIEQVGYHYREKHSDDRGCAKVANCTESRKGNDSYRETAAAFHLPQNIFSLKHHFNRCLSAWLQSASRLSAWRDVRLDRDWD